MSESEYSVEAFYTHATDQKGHTVSMRVQFPPGMANDIHALAASSDYPQYRSVNDYVRDACVHRWQWLSSWEGKNTEAMLRKFRMWLSLEETERKLSWVKDGDKLVGNFSELALNSRKSDEEMAVLRQDILAALEGDLPQSCRDKLYELLDRYF
jgi:hypothetical protein